MKPSPAIQVKNLSKRYCLPSADRAEYEMLSERVMRAITAPWRKLRGMAKPSRSCFWALDDINFDIAPGEVVGIIGRNGAGKSTLLKIISRITRPTRGEAILNGRVGSLLEVGTGFHPELTGRENIFLNGGILGMTRQEIRRQYDAIVEFSGVERFLEMPVKRYSSGMRVRLGFAVAAHLEPEILAVDEVLAVGDMAFQQKCLDRMGDVASRGRTVLFVSHNIPAIESFCDRGILLSGGKVVMDGPTSDVVARYVQSMTSAAAADESGVIDLSDHPNRRPGSRPMLQKIALVDGDGRACQEFPLGSPLIIDTSYENPDHIRDLAIALVVCSQNGQRLAMLHSRMHARMTDDGRPWTGMRCTLNELPLLPGRYRIDVGVGSWEQLYDYVEHAGEFNVLPSDYLGTGEIPNSNQGLFALKSDWTWLEPPAGSTQTPRPKGIIAGAGSQTEVCSSPTVVE